MKRLLLLAIIIIAGCAPASYSTTAKQNLTSAQAQATNAAIAEDDAARSAQATAQAVNDRSANATAQAVNATQAAISATEQARRVASEATAQAQAIAANALTLDQARVAATATRAALDRQMGIDAQSATRTAAEAQATITAANAAAAEVAQSINMHTDWYWTAPQVLMQYAPCALLIVGIILVSYIVRAVAARIAGDKDRAGIALSNPSLTIYLPTLSRAPLLLTSGDDDEENETETGNTVTPGNSGNTEETGGDRVFPVNSSAGTHPVLEQTREEYQELMTVRHEAIGLLNRCLNYYAESNTVDDGTIPRYDKLHMKSEDRQQIVDNLWYSTFVIKTKNRTYTDPQYFGTCAALMQAIISNRVKVLPLNYAERRQERLKNAIEQLPQNVRVTA